MQLEKLFSQTKDLPLEVVEGLLSALLSSRDPAAPRPSTAPSGGGLSRSISGERGEASGGGRPNTGSGGGGGINAGSGAGGGGIDADPPMVWSATGASFEAHAVLALELYSRVVLVNRHRVSRLWPSLHAFLAR